MDKRKHERGSNLSKTKGFLAGLLIGGLTGAGAMLLLAPQSGQRARARLQRKSIELREQASEGLGAAVAQARGKARQITHGLSDKAEEILQRGQDLIAEQKVQPSALGGNAEKALPGVRR